ncbi:sugar transferase [Pseudonocardia sp. NPDC049154]|uniref:sugar transferase n=1 Tax=Pseudonocardia sp. NPDC049154 TaxID=3155501 RepID=UPI0033C8CA8C
MTPPTPAPPPPRLSSGESRDGAVEFDRPRIVADPREWEGPAPKVRPVAGVRSAKRIKAWMLVLPVDLLALSAPAIWVPQHAKGVLSMAALSLLLLTGGGRYRARLHVSVLDELPIILGRLLAAGAIVATVFALRHEQAEVTGFLVSAVVGIGLVVAGRVVTNQLILLGRRRRVVAHRTVIVGGGMLGAELAGLLTRYPQYGLFPVGFVDEQEGCPAGSVSHRLGGVGDLARVVRSTASDVVIVADDDTSESRLLDVLRHPDCARCDLMIVPRLHQFCRHVGVGDHIGSIPVTRILPPRLDGTAALVKRGFDILLSATALVVCTPLLLACALAVRLEGGRGVLFSQERVGRAGERFTCYKFRTMKPASGEEAATRWSIANDGRVGTVGRILRRTGLDELPQFWNVLRGDMTLIGPRPERPHFVTKFSEEVPIYGHRHRVRTGLTGLAQVSGLRGDVPIADRARFDNYYIENWSLWLDLKILLRTVAEVVFARGR